MSQGRIELIIGCMYSGKTTELLRLIKRYSSIKKKMLIINYEGDNRYGDKNDNTIYTHDKNGIEANHISNLDDIKNKLSLRRIYQEADIIFINEGQFFDKLFEFTVNAADNDNKTIIICGLDGDYKREPFGDILKLIPQAEKITRLEALCKVCNNGTSAIFTRRIIESSEQKLIGGEESYIPVCRKHYKCNNKFIQQDKEDINSIYYKYGIM